MPTSSAIDTSRVQNRRSLHFDRVDDVLSDLNQLAIANRDGKLRSLGNWTAGQNLGHVAVWIDCYDGYPLKVPFFIRWLMRPTKNRFLHKPMRPGAKIPSIPGGTLGFDPMPFDEAAVHLRRSFERLKAEMPTNAHPIFGRMAHQDWIDMSLRHAELHMSFLRID